jgi:hypothetical protein
MSNGVVVGSRYHHRLVEFCRRHGRDRSRKNGSAFQVSEKLVPGPEAPRPSRRQNERGDPHQQQAPLVLLGSSAAVKGIDVPHPGKIP